MEDPRATDMPRTVAFHAHWKQTRRNTYIYTFIPMDPKRQKRGAGKLIAVFSVVKRVSGSVDVLTTD